MFLASWRPPWGPVCVAALTLCLGLVLGVGSGLPAAGRGPLDRPADTVGRASASGVDLVASWTETGTLTAGRRAGADIRVTGAALHSGVTVTAVFTLARVLTLPGGCRHATTVRTRSWISADGTRLTCWVRQASGSVSLPLELEIGTPSGDVPQAWAIVEATGGAAPVYLSAQAVGQGTAPPPPDFRFISSPDFLNGDVADLRKADNYWTPRSSTNSTNGQYEDALATVLGTWSAIRPDVVLVAGDLVDGRWGYDDQRTGTFGPVGSATERRAAVRLAARTYYPAWLDRFRRHDLAVFPAPGDHEYGDNPWGSRKLALAGTFRREFARAFTRLGNGSPRFADRPKESTHEMAAYAWRPHPEVQMVSLDVFDAGPTRMRARLDDPQLAWLRGVLGRARDDGVRWIVVQGHTPILAPVRERSSSGLMYEGGTSSRLWRTFRSFGVDLYLCGEVHDVTAVRSDGILQISHGGLFQFALTNFLVADVHHDRIEMTVRDFDADASDAGPRLWETRRSGMPASIRYAPDPWILGTATLWQDGTLTNRSGALSRYDP